MKTLAIVAILAIAGSAHADDKNKADKLFKEGKKLLDQKRYSDACAAFEQSAQLDPGIGVQLNIGLCYEEWGKLALAWRAFTKAEQMASDSKDSRLARIHERVQGLDAQVPRLTVHVPAGADVEALAIQLDGKPLDADKIGKQQLVDPGPHQVEYIVDGKHKSKVIPVERGANAEITLDAPVTAVKKKKPVEPKRGGDKGGGGDRTPPAPGSIQRLAAYGTAGAGVVLVGISIGVAVAAKSSYATALRDHCMGSTSMCDSTGLSETHAARSHANVATGLFVVGLAAVGGGVALYLLAPRAKRPSEHALYLAPSLGDGGGGVVFGGRY
jgi:hypothetical protein